MPVVTSLEMRVRFTDVDANGIVNNAHYLGYFGEARLEHLHQLGVLRSSDRSGDRAFTLASATCNYRSPLRHRDTFTVRCWTSEIRTRSFVLAFAIIRDFDETTVAEGTSTQVWLDAEAAPTPLPDDVRSVLEQSMA